MNLGVDDTLSVNRINRINRIKRWRSPRPTFAMIDTFDTFDTFDTLLRRPVAAWGGQAQGRERRKSIPLSLL